MRIAGLEGGCTVFVGGTPRVCCARRSAIRTPVIFLENEILYGHSFDCPDDPDFVLPIGRAKIERAGGDVTIVAYSIMVGVALAAAEVLAAEACKPK